MYLGSALITTKVITAQKLFISLGESILRESAAQKSFSLSSPVVIIPQKYSSESCLLYRISLRKLSAPKSQFGAHTQHETKIMMKG